MTWSQIGLAGVFLTMGVLHFVAPKPFVAIMPRFIPRDYHLLLVYLSGVGELLGGAGVIVATIRPWAGIWLLALLAAVLPANVQMLLNAQAAKASVFSLATLWIRLPLQLAIAWWVWRATDVPAVLG